MLMWVGRTVGGGGSTFAGCLHKSDTRCQNMGTFPGTVVLVKRVFVRLMWACCDSVRLSFQPNVPVVSQTSDTIDAAELHRPLVLTLAVSVRFGRPGVFLRHLCVPAERPDDEPLLRVRSLSQVLLLVTDQRMSVSGSPQLSKPVCVLVSSLAAADWAA